MGGATSIHIKECIIEHSVKHNLRQITPDYVRKDLSHLNEKHIVVADLNQRLEEIKILYKEKTKQKLHAKATPIREGVIVIDEHTTMGDLRLFGESCKAKWGITPLQYFIHRDEGHYDENKQWKPNYHAHIVFDWQNKVTGKSCKLNQNDMRDMQTLLAECLGMERGIRKCSITQYSLNILSDKATSKKANPHRELCLLAGKWLRNNKYKLPYVAVELVVDNAELPDAFGWILRNKECV